MDLDLSAWSHLWESGDYILLLSPRYKGDPQVEDALDRCLIYNAKYHEVLGIEDDRLSRALKRKMKDSGVPVTRDRPPGENLVQKAIKRLHEVGASSADTNRVLSALEKMRQAGMSRHEIEENLKPLMDKLFPSD